ncbi:tail fiber domain-containing protein [Bradyrhizobium sp. KB893862 SZCCT0404]|uniref:tail fiber domain-containing protein n=1 Tax=Bradyrhizobium sp. KB893862 SZCCT0404 TaxID=2807672 RepID=UPI002013A17C|nr:tail fiber domain-containing protein [Bradyrhizobium sp. KB893862 SZCCT0404]
MTPEQLANYKAMIARGGDMSGADTSTNVGMSTANAGSSALGTALQGLTNYKPTGGTDSNIAAATAYANNPAVDGMVASAMRDATRQVSEQTLPQLQRSSALTGNTLGTRSAISQGLVERGLADATADTSANIRGNLFNAGLQLAENGRQADNSASLSALNSAAGAGNSAVNSGVGAIGSGISQAGGLFDLANTGGSGLQQNAQNAIDNSKGMSEYANGTAAQNLQNFFNIIGSNNWGGTQTGTSTSTPSTWSTIGSALGMGASLFKLSDRRLKTDIRCIGAADNGLPIYTFRYINDPKGELHMGFMAQDVEKVRPEAVSKVGGVMAVNYELASK